MRIFLRGGPRDGECVTEHMDNDGVPFEYLNLPRPVSDPVLIQDDGFDICNSVQDVLRYKLESILVDGKLHHYEYIYQGR